MKTALASPAPRPFSTKVGVVLAIVGALFVAALLGPADVSRAASPPALSDTVSPLPDNFMWGVSSSAFQSEGGRTNSNWQEYVDKETNGVDPYFNSVDFLHRYPEDISLAKGLGVTHYRIGINWARVEPRKGHIDSNALAFYDDLINQLKANGIEPVITLDHFAYPDWVLKQGGWDTVKTQNEFVGYAKLIVDRYRSQVKWWLTFNEPTCYVLVDTLWRKMNPVQMGLMYKHLIGAHRAIYDYVHSVRSDAMVSSNECTPGMLPVLRSTFDSLMLNKIKDKIDFVGIDYYFKDTSVPEILHQAAGTPWKIKLKPDGIYDAIMHYKKKFPDLPLVITENGMPTDNGKPREDSWTRGGDLQDSLYWVQKAMDDGANVLGYFYWSLTDNYEWGSYQPRFGLYTVDVTTDPTLTRRPTDAVAVYRNLVMGHGVGGYVPTGAPH